MNYIEVNKLAILCKIGVSDGERAHPQKVYISCKISTDFGPCMKSDRIEDTINYKDLIDVIETISQECSFKLIESFAEKVQQSIKDLYKCTYSEVTIRKPSPIKNAEYAAFTLTS